MKIDFTSIRTLGYITLLVFGLGGIALSWFTRETPLWEFYQGFYSIPVQLLTGYLFGLICGYSAWFVVTRGFMRDVHLKYSRIIGQMKLSTRDIWFISICAGVGEELFFRAGLQPLLGIWITAIFFVAIHGYLSPFNWRITIYGIIMCFFMAGLGYLTEEVGILSAIVAHMIIDVILLKRLAHPPESS